MTTPCKTPHCDGCKAFAESEDQAAREQRLRSEEARRVSKAVQRILGPSFSVTTEGSLIRAEFGFGGSRLMAGVVMAPHATTGERAAMWIAKAVKHVHGRLEGNVQHADAACMVIMLGALDTLRIAEKIKKSWGIEL